MRKGRAPKGHKASSRLARTVRSLLAISALGATLAAYNAYSLSRDVRLATGPHSEAQHAFFLNSADRPDIDLFYKGLTSAQRLVMANRIGEYDDPQLAGLIGKLLGSFDASARTLLTRALAAVGKAHPEPVAEQLKQTGSLQLFAIGAALKDIGNSDLPSVAAQLKVTEARPHAVAYLVGVGEGAAPFLMPYLEDPNKDVRLAAADALGKIGARSAVPALLAKYRGAQGDERFGYLSALAAIGDPSTEPLLGTESDDPSLSTPRRAQAMLGLGRIGSPTAVAKLWSFAHDDDRQVRESMISALQLAGNVGLGVATIPSIGLKIAAGVRTPAASAYIAGMLRNSSTMFEAASVAGHRPDLVPALLASLRATSDGAAIDESMRALASTPQGSQRLKQLISDPTLGGFAMRRLRLG